MLNCREAVRHIASEDIARAGLLKRIELRLHLMMCSHCRRYSRHVGLLGAAARRLWGPELEDPAELKRLEMEIVAAARRTDDCAH
jgi:predicted anti-sigma-YlaC factor YlaD